MSDTEIMVPLSELLSPAGRVSIKHGIVTKLTARTESISFMRDADGSVIGFSVQRGNDDYSYFSLSPEQCEAFALTLAPWLKHGGG